MKVMLAILGFSCVKDLGKPQNQVRCFLKKTSLVAKARSWEWFQGTQYWI